MIRMISIVAAGVLLGLPSFGGDSNSVTNWFSYGKSDAASAEPDVRDGVLSLVGNDKAGSTYWSVFNPIALEDGKSVTVSLRLKTPEDLPPGSATQIRIGIFGTVAGTSPTATKQADLRGFIFMGGSAQKIWRISLGEHARADGSLIHMAGITNRATAQFESNGGRGVETRVVITVARKSAELMSLSGFWGDVPFSFDVKPLAGDYTHLRAIVLMRGGKSGTDELKFSNVRIRSD